MEGGPDMAPRRTQLATERTYLAWLRTALAAFGLAVAVGRLLPALVDAEHTRFGLLGAGYGVFGLVVLGLAAYRARRATAAVRAGAALPADEWTVWLLTLFGAILGGLTLLLVLAGL
jgi:putative membrane protein